MDGSCFAADLVARPDLLDARKFRDADGGFLHAADPFLPAAFHARPLFAPARHQHFPDRRGGGVEAIPCSAAQQRNHICCRHGSLRRNLCTRRLCLHQDALSGASPSIRRCRCDARHPCLCSADPTLSDHDQDASGRHLYRRVADLRLGLSAALPLAAAQRLRAASDRTRRGCTARWRRPPLHLLQHRAAARRTRPDGGRHPHLPGGLGPIPRSSHLLAAVDETPDGSHSRIRHQEFHRLRADHGKRIDRHRHPCPGRIFLNRYLVSGLLAGSVK